MGLLVDGSTSTFEASGTADLAGTTAISRDTRFRIASITKPIVAALVMTAVDRGEVSLDDVVGDLLPGALRADPPVTVRQLLDHTSGIFDEGNEGDPLTDIERLTDSELRAEARDLLDRYRAGETDIVTPGRLIVALAETHDRYFAPGEGYRNSNVNFQLAAMVLEQATGQSLAETLRDRIVDPLGLTKTSLAPDDARSPGLRGYDRQPDGTLADRTDDLTLYGNGGNGGVITTADELATMLRAIVTGGLFPRGLVTTMTTPNRSSYGLGIATYTSPCGTFLGHGGSVSGTDSIAHVSPDGSRAFVLAVNARGGPDPLLAPTAVDVLCD